MWGLRIWKNIVGWIFWNLKQSSGVKVPGLASLWEESLQSLKPPDHPWEPASLFLENFGKVLKLWYLPARSFFSTTISACVTHAVCQEIGSFYQLLLSPDTKNSATHWVCGWLCRVAPQLRIGEHVSRYFVILGIKGFKIKIYDFLQNSSLIGACEQVSWNLKCLLSTTLVTW